MLAARPTLLALLGIIMACEPDDRAAICASAGPVHLLAPADSYVDVLARPAGGRTVFVLEHADGSVDTWSGLDCGAAPTLAVRGARALPAAAQLDERDDDPHTTCIDGHFFHLTLRDAQPPTIVLPDHTCGRLTPTPSGPVVVGGDVIGADQLWLLPQFPASDGGVQIAARANRFEVQGEMLYYLDDDRGLHAHDLASGNDTLLRASVDMFQTTATHLLWQERVDGDVRPIRLIDLASGAEIDLGVFDPEVDGSFIDGRGGLTTPWLFTIPGAHVLHFPRAWAVDGEAFDLDGRRLALPLPGSPLDLLDGGAVVGVRPGDDRLFAVRPGDAEATLLDAVVAPPSNDDPAPLRIDADGVNLYLDGDLLDVPLDGGPARLLAAQVGEKRVWLDDRRLLTIFEGTLLTVDGATGRRTAHAGHVADFARLDDGALYYLVDQPGDPAHGLWYVPADAPLPAL